MVDEYILGQMAMLTDDQRRDVARYGFVPFEIEFRAGLELRGSGERQAFVAACVNAAK